jgi:hypothetical protein
MHKFLMKFGIAVVFYALWILAIPWFLVALNRRFSTSPKVRRFMVPQPSRLILQHWMRQKPTPYGDEFAGPGRPEPRA